MYDLQTVTSLALKHKCVMQTHDKCYVNFYGKNMNFHTEIKSGPIGMKVDSRTVNTLLWMLNFFMKPHVYSSIMNFYGKRYQKRYQTSQRLEYFTTFI